MELKGYSEPDLSVSKAQAISLIPYFAPKDVSGLTCFLRDTGSMVFIKVDYSQAGVGTLYSGGSVWVSVAWASMFTESAFPVYMV